MWQQIQLQDRMQTFYMPVNQFFSSYASDKNGVDDVNWRCCLLPTTGMVQAWVGHFVTPLKCTYDKYD